jgi:hypothetical protein
MNEKPQTSKEFFISLQIIFWALIAGQLMFTLIVIFLRANQFVAGTEELGKIFSVIVPLLCVSGIGTGWWLSRQRIEAAKARGSLAEKLNDYRSILIIRWALLEGPIMFAIISYLLTGNYIFLGITGLMILVFLYFRPSRQKAGKDLQLNPYEEETILNPDKVI